MVVLDPAVRLQGKGQPATGRFNFSRTTRLYFVVRSLFLRWGKLAVPSVVYYQPPARLLLPVRASNACYRIVHPKYSWLLPCLSPVGLPRTRSQRTALGGRLDLYPVGDDLYVVDGDLLRQYDHDEI